MEPNYQKRLCQQCERRGITLSEAPLERLLQYLDLLLRWRSHLNLTGLRDAERIIDVLIAESLDFFQGGFLVPGMRVLDLGTGAGVPGIPLASCSTGLHFTLLDRSEKKITFLRRVVSLLRLENCQPDCSTAEDLARALTLPQRFDAVVSRGVGHITHLLRLTAPLLCPGGTLLVRKPLQTPELQEAAPLLATAIWGEVQMLPLLQDASSPWVLLAIPRLAQDSGCG
jgi:16S rRNA (guanine527-N7)-methyltransferase